VISGKPALLMWAYMVGAGIASKRRQNISSHGIIMWRFRY
jgi:hypothetical protein